MTIESDIRALADRAAIEDLIVQYAKGRDTTEPALYRACFAEDATIAINGRVLSHDLDEILAKVFADQGRFNPGYTGDAVSWAMMSHQVSNVLTRVDGDSATGEYDVISFGYDESRRRPDLISVAHHTDSFARRDGRWWITASSIAPGWENDEMGRALKVGPYTPAEYRR